MAAIVAPKRSTDFIFSPTSDLSPNNTLEGSGIAGHKTNYMPFGLLKVVGRGLVRIGRLLTYAPSILGDTFVLNNIHQSIYLVTNALHPDSLL